MGQVTHPTTTMDDVSTIAPGSVVVIRDEEWRPAISAVFGPTRTELAGRTPSGRWRAVLDSVTTTLGPDLANEAFLAAEYATVVLPRKITVADDYLKVRRPGRGVALDRARRSAVWELFEAYRAHNRIDGTVDYAEAAAARPRRARA